jgi:hypothetical protein
MYPSILKYKSIRHFAFWIAIICYQLMVDFIVCTFVEGMQYSVLKESIELVILYLPGQLVMVYCLLYFIIPDCFLKSNYFLGVVLVFFLCIVSGIINEASYRTFVDQYHLFPSLSGKHSLGMHRILGTGGFAAFIKLMHFWYEKNYYNSVLEKEKVNAELAILRSQLNPHFLFNTLNNIYSITQNSSPEAADMIQRLCALLRYILYDCNLPEIPLSQSFTIIKDYISLERIRYEKTLDINIQLPEVSDDYLIAPLLLLPLVENCFKHGTSKTTDHQWINIKAEVKGNNFYIKLINSKPEHISTPDRLHKGIGLSNIRKRLELLYPKKHSLEIHEEDDLFVVVLKLELHVKSASESNEHSS